MKYKDMTNPQIERVFAEDVLGWTEGNVYPNIMWWMCEGKSLMYQGEFLPLTDLNHAMMGMEKLGHDYSLNKDKDFGLWMSMDIGKKFPVEAYADTPQAAIVEACIRIKRPDLFEGD